MMARWKLCVQRWCGSEYPIVGGEGNSRKPLPIFHPLLVWLHPVAAGVGGLFSLCSSHGAFTFLCQAETRTCWRNTDCAALRLQNIERVKKIPRALSWQYCQHGNARTVTRRQSFYEPPLLGAWEMNLEMQFFLLQTLCISKLNIFLFSLSD